MSTTCFCPPHAKEMCSPADETHYLGRRLCCPYDDEGMAAWYGESLATYLAQPSKSSSSPSSAAEYPKQRACVRSSILVPAVFTS